MFKVVRETCIAGAVIDVTVKGSNHVCGNCRKPKLNPTPEAVKKNNDRIAAKNLTRILNANFYPGDYHVTLTYQGEEPGQEEAERELQNFLRRMRRQFKKANKEFKYIAVTEFVNHRIHHHVVMSYIDIRTIAEQWKRGMVRTTPLDRNRNYAKLAEYLIKETTKTFRDADNVFKKRYTCSRNLERPVVMREEVPAYKLHGEIKALKGYEIDRDSVRRFENPITGLEHLEYSMISTDPTPRLKKWRNGEVVKKGETLLKFDCFKQLYLEGKDWELMQ